MSDEFDSLDATEKAAVEGALNNAKRPSDDVVQTAPKHRRLLPLQAGIVCRAAMTAEQEKAQHDALGPVLFINRRRNRCRSHTAARKTADVRSGQRHYRRGGLNAAYRR
jgi:hypothetical protein